MDSYARAAASHEDVWRQDREYQRYLNHEFPAAGDEDEPHDEGGSPARGASEEEP